MPITENYDIVIYGGTFAGVAAACKAATYIKANGGGKRIAVIIPDVSGMLGGIGTAGGQNYIDIQPNKGNQGTNDGVYHGGTFGYVYKKKRKFKQYYSPGWMSDLFMTVINNQNKDPQGNPLYPPIIDLYPDLTDENTPAGIGYDIYDITKNSSSGKIESVSIKAIYRSPIDGYIKYDNSISTFTLTADTFIDASDDGKLTSISGVGPSIGRQDWPEEDLPINDERCSEYSSRQQAATLMFKATLTRAPNCSDSDEWKSGTMGAEEDYRASLYQFNDNNDLNISIHPENKYFALKPWNAAKDGDGSNDWWFNVLLIFDVDGRAHERDRNTSMFPIDMRPDYLTTDEAWTMAKQYIKDNKSALEIAILNSINPSVSVTSVSICTDNLGDPIVGETLYLRETVHTTINHSNNSHGTEYSNYAVTPLESIKAGDKNGYYHTGIVGCDGGNETTCIGLNYYGTDINAYQKSDLKSHTGANIWGAAITKKLRPNLLSDLGITRTKPYNAVFMPYESLITSRVPNLLIPGVACCVASLSWAEVRVLPNLCVLGDAAGVAAGYSVIHNVDAYSFSANDINAVKSFLSNNIEPKAELVKLIDFNGNR